MVSRDSSCVKSKAKEEVISLQMWRRWAWCVNFFPSKKVYWEWSRYRTKKEIEFTKGIGWFPCSTTYAIPTSSSQVIKPQILRLPQPTIEIFLLLEVAKDLAEPIVVVFEREYRG